MNENKFDLEQFFVDDSCASYGGDGVSVNFRLWQFIKGGHKSREQCRVLLKDAGVERHVSQRTSSALNWLRVHHYIRSTRDSAIQVKSSISTAQVIKEAPKEELKPNRSMDMRPIPRLDNGEIDFGNLNEIIHTRGGVSLGPPMTPKQFIESHMKNKPKDREGQILVAARNSKSAWWDQVRDVIHKEFRSLCDCKLNFS